MQMKWLATTLMTGLAMAACITRPVGTDPPTTKVNFTATQAQRAVDKVDILFAIDNSSSMGDKQALLADAVPNLLQGLLFPHCVDPDTTLPVDATRADPVASKADHYGCKRSPTGKQLEAELRPITDLHIGIVSSSLGGMGGDGCANVTGHGDDRGHLLGRRTDSAAAAGLTPASFLAWFPESEENKNDPKRHPRPSNPVARAEDLASYFRSLVLGTAQDGCGLEAQLESVYRFLVQPDPYVAVGKDKDGRAELGTDIDWDLLAERAQFLRPDSLVAVVMLTDEDDSSADPLSVFGLGYNWASNAPSPMPTSICATDPASPSCTSCGLRCSKADTSAACLAIKSDPNCTKTQPGATSAGRYAAADDALNVRFFHMKERFGVDPQFPVSRYVNGLSGPTVPDRSTEHPVTLVNGERSVSSYVGTNTCTNPLFAKGLPTKEKDETCKLEKGPRDPSLVFFAIVGGVPNELIYGTDADGHVDYRPEEPEHNAMTDAKWMKVLGKDPLHFDRSGLDPHMIQSIAARPGIAGDPTALRGDNGPDSIVGRDWSTNRIDLQFACTFDLAETQYKACAGQAECDCNPPAKSPDGTSLPASNQPLCQAATTNVQTRAKAYPTVRELEVARALGTQGITASLCPVDPALTNDPLADKTSPKYGYNPAVASIIDRLKNALTQECLPQSLRDLPDGGVKDGDPALEVPCLVLAQLDPDGSGDCATLGLEEVKQEVLDVFLEEQLAAAKGSTDGLLIAKRKVCTVPQAVAQPGESCKTLPQRRWCYVENAGGTKKPAGRCQQAIVLSSATQDLGNARFSLQCIRQFSAGAAAGDR